MHAQDDNAFLQDNLRLNITEEVENTILQKEIKEEINAEKIPNEPNKLIQDETEKQTKVKKPEIVPIKADLKPIITTDNKKENEKQEISPIQPPLKVEIVPLEKNPKLLQEQIKQPVQITQKEKQIPKAKEIRINNNPFELNENVLNYTLYNKLPQKEKPEGIIYQEAEKELSSIDPQKTNPKATYYPGLRGPNQLIVYTPYYGARTGTNEFGTEAIVKDNMVVELNGADSIIPSNGFVISGHGKAKTWIKQNLQVGSIVYLDRDTNSIRVYLTPKSLTFAAKEKLKEANNLIEYYKNIDILYNDKKATEYLEQAKDYLRKVEKRPEKTQQYITNAMENLNLSIKNAIPYSSKELKGVWIRPTEQTPSAIEKTIERIHKAGITDIFLEVYFHGKTIYPSEYLKSKNIISQREEFVGFDPLEIWMKETKKRDMKVHIWFESFYVGNDNPQTTPNHILSVYPTWANRRYASADNDIPQPSLSEHNGYFLDPANPQVHEHLLGIISEIITNYKPAGINLDYIRYPQTIDPSFSNYDKMNWGYTPFAREEFKAIYNIDPIEITYNTGAWELWALYRQNQISEFIQEVKKLTQQESILLTAVVFPDLKKSMDTKMQNWRMWSVNNFVDGLTPLILTCDKNTSDLLIKDVVNNTSSMTKIYPGLFVPFMNGAFENLLFQIQKTREYKSAGAILFDYAHLKDEYTDAVSTRVYNKTYDQKVFNVRTKENYVPEVKLKEKKKRKRKKDKN